MRITRTFSGLRRAAAAAAATMLLVPLWGAAEEPLSDADISLAVIERMFNDAGVENALVDVAVDDDMIEVAADNGEVRLTGTVESWSERQTAAENAYEGGAMRVDNDLRVRYGPDYYAP